MSFHLRQMNKLPRPKEFHQEINPKPERLIKQIELERKNSSLNRPINSKSHFTDFILDSNDKIKLKNALKEYLEEKIFIDQLAANLLQISNKQNQQFRVKFDFYHFSNTNIDLFLNEKNPLIQSIRKFVRPNDLDRFDISILKDELKTLKVSSKTFFEKKGKRN